MATRVRATRLQYCVECNRDYPATRFRDSGIVYWPHPVTGWTCPHGHITKLCNEGEHDKRSDDGLNWECSRCDAMGLMLP